MNIEERPLSPVLQSELDVHFRDGLKTIGCSSTAIGPDKIAAQLIDFLVEFEKAKSQFNDRQIEALLVQLGAVLANLFIEKYGWTWTCAKDESEKDFYFVVSRDKKLMLQPWTFLQDCVQHPEPYHAVRNLISLPDIAALSDEVMKSDLLYQDIGMAFMAMGALAAFSQDDQNN
jgi:hypothetical protein